MGFLMKHKFTLDLMWGKASFKQIGTRVLRWAGMYFLLILFMPGFSPLWCITDK